jgi:hypothetical protein
MGQFCGSAQASAEKARNSAETPANSNGQNTSAKKKKAEHKPLASLQAILISGTSFLGLQLHIGE